MGSVNLFISFLTHSQSGSGAGEASSIILISRVAVRDSVDQRSSAAVAGGRLKSPILIAAPRPAAFCGGGGASNLGLANSRCWARGLETVFGTYLLIMARRPETSKGFSNLSSAPDALNLPSSNSIKELQSI